MSSRAFTHFLFLVGLNFIKPLDLAAVSGPSFYFGSKLENVPSREYYDVLELGEDLWLGGDGLFRLHSGGLDAVLPEGRYTALLREPGSFRVWYANAGHIGFLDGEDGELMTIPHEAGFVWDLAWHENRLWYFGSLSHGWIDPGRLRMGGSWDVPFSPRPFVSKTDDNLFVGSYAGLWKMTTEGRQLVMPAASTGNVVNWIQGAEGDYLLGTADHLFRWSGQADEKPVRLETNYGDFYQKGINNAVDFTETVAVTEYPLGVAFVEKSSGNIHSYAGDKPFLNIGDIYKIRKAAAGELLVLGVEGIGKVDVASASRFFPAAELLGGESPRASIASDEAGFIFTGSRWVGFNEKGYEGGELLWVANWAALDPEGRPALGAVNSYEVFDGEKWIRSDFPEAVSDFVWGEANGYAVGVDGLYSVSKGLDLDLIYRTDEPLSLIGELNSRLYAVIDNELVISLQAQEEAVYTIRTEFPAREPIVDYGLAQDGVWVVSESMVYHLSGEGVEEYPVAPGWRVKAMAGSRERAYFLYASDSTRAYAIGYHDKDGAGMVTMPGFAELGDLNDLIANDTRLGVIATRGIGWYAEKELVKEAVPRVSFDLLFEDKRVEDRTIPSGMHFIDLQVNFHDPAIPSLVQYRINEQRWRNVNLQDPSMQFAGHGTFTVELRAMHPNGNTSPVKMVQFGIAPPWYLNPLYQGIMLVVLLLIIWGLFYLRSAQLKRTNLWLQKEVKKQTRELEAATAARTNFLAGLSHDIRNPLNGVLMIAETLSRHPPTSGEDPRLRDLTEFGVIVDRMLGEILDFSAIDQRNIPTAYIPVSITDIIHSSIKQNQFGIQKEMVTINKTIAPEVEDVIIRTDRNWMIKILTNLIVNALEYAETDRIEVGVKCGRLTDHEVDLEFHVADYGKGIDDSEKDLVFERFYRGESGIESGKHGTGLGLSICQEIAHAMGAHLSLTDNEPTGCRFILKGRFDRVEDAMALDKEAVLDSLKGKRILVVDDLVYNRRSIVEFFQTIGSDCDEAENGHEALALLEKNRYYLALLDWDLPGLTGPEIARRHRKNTPEDPVILIAVTAYTDGGKKRESEEAGMNGYISKPLTAVRLAYCLANIQDWKPREKRGPDVVDADEVQEEIYKHIDDCLRHGEAYEWENLRRCAHRLTTLAMIRDNQGLQQVCRDLQVSAKEADIQEIQVGLLELQQWKRP